MEETLSSEGESDRVAPIRYRAVEPGMRLGRYQLGEELGSGGMATVYQARDLELRRDVAIKVLFPHLCKKREVVARFQREARAAAGLDHPHILRVYDVGGGPSSGTSDPPYIVLELVRGKSLRELISDRGSLLAEAVACAGAVLCEALAVAHAAGVIHRDIKPANVMVAEGGRLVLADFGVARIDDEDSSLVTRTGALLGTPAFMSPEQAQGAGLDPRSDIYSLGATLYQLATGHIPYSGSTAQVVSKIIRADLMPPQRHNPKLGPDLPAVITRMMSADRDRRPATATEAGRALEEVYRAVGIEDPDAELAELLADPDAYVADREARIAATTLELAQAAADERKLPRAMALADRVLALDPDNGEALALVEQLGRGHWLSWSWKLGAVAVAMLAAVALVVFGWSQLPSIDLAAYEVEDAGAVDAAPDAASRIDAAVVDAAAVVVEPDARAPATARRLPRKIRRRRPDAGVELAVAPDAMPATVRRPPSPPDARPAWASVEFVFNAWCDLFIDGAAKGRAMRQKRYRLSAGVHQLACRQGPGLGHWERSVTLKPGEHRRVVGSVIAPVRVVIALVGGDTARIGGRNYRNGMRVTLRPDRYRVDVLLGGKRVGSQWVTIPRGRTCTLRDRPALGCYR